MSDFVSVDVNEDGTSAGAAKRVVRGPGSAAGEGSGLAVAGEARYRLGPLAVPGIGPNEPGHYAAVELFADRASRVDPGFALDGTTAR
jgi:predicted ATPase